ncbi:hypothetical protein ABL78_8390 [Leptomonas seymouri]|uniref:Uncharacterized protein n=1 Tax=Leptomonas seymouri TaxID=5684 RepID=A0A0N1IH44_LEPSE|nr:hypothetical protein ABL78_8390 [Leptomonas seymouri]|eukprot:KPI82600.1 hypothetical protein ABL78_8390 [Leptomonas seymouri]
MSGRNSPSRGFTLKKADFSSLLSQLSESSGFFLSASSSAEVSTLSESSEAPIDGAARLQRRAPSYGTRLGSPTSSFLFNDLSSPGGFVTGASGST